MAKAKLIRLSVKDKPGTVAAAIAALAEARVNIVSIFGWGPQGALELVVDNPRKAMAALKKLKMKFTEGEAQIAELANRPGSLHAHLEKLAKKGVNLRSLHACGSRTGRKSTVAWTSGK
jgi:hypothetical protein